MLHYIHACCIVPSKLSVEGYIRYTMIMFVRINTAENGDLTIRFELPKIPAGLFRMTQLLSRDNRLGALSWIVKKLTQLTTVISAQYYVILMGLGLGIGMSMSSVVLNNPLSVQATPLVISDEIGVQPYRIGVNPAQPDDTVLLESHQNWRNLSWILSDQTYYYETSALLHQSGGPLVFFVGANSLYYPTFADFELGEKITLIGKNNGIYIYEGIEIREVSLEALGTFFLDPQQYANKAVVVYKSPGFSSSFTVLVANKAS